MRKATAFIYLLVAVLIGGFTACNNTSKKAAATNTSTQEKQNIEEQVRDAINPLPSAKEVTDMLNEIKAEYIIGLANDAFNAEKYSRESDQAINLGIYGADLSYASTYKQQSDASAYIKSCETLIKALDISSAIGSDILTRVENNLDNKEALSKEISEIFQYSYGTLCKEKKPELASLILAGSWVEGMYLTTSVSANTVQNPKIVSTLLFQKQSFALLLNDLGKYKESPLCKDIYTQLLDIDTIYQSNPDSQSISLKQLNQLTAKINDIRTKLVQLK